MLLILDPVSKSLRVNSTHSNSLPSLNISVLDSLLRYAQVTTNYQIPGLYSILLPYPLPSIRLYIACHLRHPLSAKQMKICCLWLCLLPPIKSVLPVFLETGTVLSPPACSEAAFAPL